MLLGRKAKEQNYAEGEADDEDWEKGGEHDEYDDGSDVEGRWQPQNFETWVDL